MSNFSVGAHADRARRRRTSPPTHGPRWAFVSPRPARVFVSSSLRVWSPGAPSPGPSPTLWRSRATLAPARWAPRAGLDQPCDHPRSRHPRRGPARARVRPRRARRRHVCPDRGPARTLLAWARLAAHRRAVSSPATGASPRRTYSEYRGRSAPPRPACLPARRPGRDRTRRPSAGHRAHPRPPEAPDVPRRSPVCRDLPAGRALAYPLTCVRSEFPKIGALWPCRPRGPGRLSQAVSCTVLTSRPVMFTADIGTFRARHRPDEVPARVPAIAPPDAATSCGTPLIDETWSWSPRPAVVGRRPAIRTACWPEPPRPVEPHPAPRQPGTRSRV